MGRSKIAIRPRLRRRRIRGGVVAPAGATTSGASLERPAQQALVDG
jgi:hypothetical protein